MIDGNLKPIDFEEANKKMVADGCGDLPVFHAGSLYLSCWKLTEEQVEVIAKTKCVWLGVFGAGQPPVYLTVELPFTSPSDWPEQIGGVDG